MFLSEYLKKAKENISDDQIDDRNAIDFLQSELKWERINDIEVSQYVSLWSLVEMRQSGFDELMRS